MLVTMRQALNIASFLYLMKLMPMSDSAATIHSKCSALPLLMKAFPAHSGKHKDHAPLVNTDWQVYLAQPMHIFKIRLWQIILGAYAAHSKNKELKCSLPRASTVQY